MSKISLRNKYITDTNDTVRRFIACFMTKLVDTNSDGGSLLGIMSEEACAQQCLARYPDCLAVDYRTSDQSCYWHNIRTGTQWNDCCNRYIVNCTRTYSSNNGNLSYTQPPMRRMRICFTDVFFLFLFCFFLFFFCFPPFSDTKYQTTVLGNG